MRGSLRAKIYTRVVVSYPIILSVDIKKWGKWRILSNQRYTYLVLFLFRAISALYGSAQTWDLESRSVCCTPIKIILTGS